METKKEIRKAVLEKRRQYPEEKRRGFSLCIAERVISHPYFTEASEIYCYVDFDGEVETARMINEALIQGKQVYVPKVQGEVIEFYPIRSLAELSRGSFGILEPSLSEDSKRLPAVSGTQRSSRALMIMPGVAFDASRSRIGYGRGYYDRYLENHEGFRTIALAFECQMVEEIPTEKTDIRPQLVITEKRILGDGEEK